MEYLIRDVKGEKDEIVGSFFEKEGFVYVYKLKETLPFSEIVKSLPYNHARDREDESGIKNLVTLPDKTKMWE